jgi:AraC family transcriptional regulator
MAALSHGQEKYGTDGLLASSVERGWSGLSAELRSHRGGVIEWKNTQLDTEICVAIRGSRSVITRHGSGVRNRTVALRGTAWLSPAGLQEDFIQISDAVPEILHLYLSRSHFSPDGLGVEVDRSVITSLRYESGFQDALLSEIACALATELRTPTSAGRLLAETLAAGLAARLIQNHVCPAPGRAFSRIMPGGLDRRRLTRVLDYIQAHLGGDLTIDCLARLACLSRFHFARAFKAATGQSPHQYISAQRLEYAKALLIREDQPLADIALSLNFSCQANFTRAFRRATGQTPGQYRHGIRLGDPAGGHARTAVPRRVHRTSIPLQQEMTKAQQPMQMRAPADPASFWEGSRPIG